MTVVGIFGPTGCGKTEVAVEVAAALGTEVINCDPAQCYGGLPILTNKPSPEHDAIAPHRLIGLWPPDHEATVGEFTETARALTDELVSENGAAVLCGGSGLYLLAALTELEFAPAGGVGVSAAESPELATRRLELEAEVRELGPEASYARLQELDPTAAARIHPNDSIRLVRALEAAERGASVAHGGGSIWDAPLRRPESTTIVHLVVDRPVTHRRIDQRTLSMFDRGIIEEVRALVGDNPEGRVSSTFRKVHGMQDCCAHIAGEISEAEAIRRMQARTRQYAKRQDTWGRRWPGAHHLAHDPEQPAATAQQIVGIARPVR